MKLEEIKDRMRDSNIGVQRGEKHPLYGKNRPIEWRKQHSERMKGEKHPSYGKYGSDNPKSKSVICLTTNKVFGSIKEAMSFLFYKTQRRYIVLL